MNFAPNNLCYYMANLYASNKNKDDKLIICNEGGSRSSKTWDTFHFIVMFCDHNRNKFNEIYILRDTLVNCRDFTLKEFIKCLQVIEIFDKTKLTTSPKPYYNLFGNHIYFRGLDDEVNTEGYPSDIIFVNEALETTKGSVNGLKMRCRKLMIMDWNPKYVKHWCFDLEGQPNVFFTHTTYRNNKYLEKSIIKEIEGYEPTEDNIEAGTADEFRYKVYNLGLRAATDEIIFKKWDEFTEYPEGYDLKIYGLDFGFSSDPTTVIEILIDKYNIWAKEVFYEKGSDNPKFPDDLTNPILAKHLLQILNEDCYLVCDSAEPKSIQELILCGVSAIACIKGPGSINAGIDKIKSKKLHIHKDSLHLKEELRAYSYQKERDGTVTNVPIDKFNHCIDALRYGVSYFHI